MSVGPPFFSRILEVLTGSEAIKIIGFPHHHKEDAETIPPPSLRFLGHSIEIFKLEKKEVVILISRREAQKYLQLGKEVLEN